MQKNCIDNWEILLYVGKNLTEARRQQTRLDRSKNSWGFYAVAAMQF